MVKRFHIRVALFEFIVLDYYMKNIVFMKAIKEYGVNQERELQSKKVIK
jgi:hypothetical protein